MSGATSLFHEFTIDKNSIMHQSPHVYYYYYFTFHHVYLIIKYINIYIYIYIGMVENISIPSCIFDIKKY